MTIDQILSQYWYDWVTVVFGIISCVFSFLAQMRVKKLSITNDKEPNGTEQTPAETPETNAATAVALSSAATKEVKEDMNFYESYEVGIDVNVSGGNAAVTATCTDKKTGASLNGAECAAKLREIADAISAKKEA